MNPHEMQLLVGLADDLRRRLDWSKYPKLAKMFQHRPPQNVYWIELAQLIEEVQG